MKIFITGATGLIGNSLILMLLQKPNTELYLLTRNLHKVSSALRSSNRVHLIQGSLENMPEWAAQLAGMEIVIHMAGPVVFWGPWSMYQTSIVEANTNLLHFANQYHVQRFIYISSESVLQDKHDLLDVDETTPYPPKNNSYYGKAKKMAEQAILADHSDMTHIIIRPTFIWGPGANAFKLMGNKINNGQFMWTNHGTPIIEMVYVDNITHAIVLACTHGNNDDIFFITDDAPKSANEFLTPLFAAQGITTPKKSILKPIAEAAANLIEGTWKLLHLKSIPPLTRFDLSFLAMQRRYNIDKAKTVLGYHPIVSFEEGLQKLKEN